MHTYQYIVLPSGFSPIVRAFTKFLATQFKYLRSKGHFSVRYIDDALLLGELFEICFNKIIATVGHLRELGFTIHQEMSVLIPTKQTIFLGFVIDFLKMIIDLDEERKQSIYMFCQNILSNYEATIREQAQTLGVPSF